MSNMKLYLVERRDASMVKYDEYSGFVIRAKSPRAARKWAADECSDEGPEVWMDVKLTKVQELKPEGVVDTILSDHYGG